MSKTRQQVYIFDTTLRDGQQSPGAGMSWDDNLLYAQYASELGIDVIEAGFPSASNDDFAIVHEIVKNLTAAKSATTVSALCQLREEQIVRTMEALEPGLAAGKVRLHTYVAVDKTLMQASLGKLANDYAMIVDHVQQYIEMAVKAGFEVEFSPEGYSRCGDNFDFTTDVIRAALSAGARVINCPDTIGGGSRWQGENFFVRLMQRHQEIMAKEFPKQDIIWSAHCHNDLGLALDNSISAVFSGPARQIEGCLNGVGERAGNVALEQCIMVIEQFGKTAHPVHEYFTNIKLEKLHGISDFVAKKMLPRQPHWPITGDNAARHTSGGHTNAILKNPLAYQPFDPSIVGNKISFVFGPLSGSNHAKQIIEDNGFHCPEAEKTTIAQSIKDQYATRRKGITDVEVVLGFKRAVSPIKIDKIDYAKDSDGHAVLHIIGQFFSEQDVKIAEQGKNSALAALAHAVAKHFPGLEIADYQSKSVNSSSANAECESSIDVSLAEKTFPGIAVDQDINISAIKAYINAVNEAYVVTKYGK